MSIENVGLEKALAVLRRTSLPYVSSDVADPQSVEHASRLLVALDAKGVSMPNVIEALLLGGVILRWDQIDSYLFSVDVYPEGNGAGVCVDLPRRPDGLLDWVNANFENVKFDNLDDVPHVVLRWFLQQQKKAGGA